MERIRTDLRLLAPPPPPDDACPRCGGRDLAEPTRDQLLTIAGWTEQEAREAAVDLGRGMFGFTHNARSKLVWCPACERIVPAGRFDRKWFLYTWEWEPVPDDYCDPALDRYCRDKRLADYVHGLRLREHDAPRHRADLHERLTAPGPLFGDANPGLRGMATTHDWLREEVEGCWRDGRPWCPPGLAPVPAPAWWHPAADWHATRREVLARPGVDLRLRLAPAAPRDLSPALRPAEPRAERAVNGVSPPPVPAPDPPGRRLPCGPKELPPLPPGADPDEWEWVPDDEEMDDALETQEETGGAG
jgi:hypothetical protein